MSGTIALKVEELTNEQIIKWYAKHHNATVRALVERLAKTQSQIVDAYVEGVEAGLLSSTPNGHTLTVEEELRAYGADW